MCIVFEISIKIKKFIFIFFLFSWQKTVFLIYGEKPNNDLEIKKQHFAFRFLNDLKFFISYFKKTYLNEIFNEQFAVFLTEFLKCL